jgi:hypothetical protein
VDVGSVAVEGVQRALDRPHVEPVQRKAMALDEGAKHALRIPLVECRRGADGVVRGKQIGDRYVTRQPLRPLTRKQRRHELGAVAGGFEQRLVHQVQVAVLAPDVHDERHCRAQRGDIAEVLLRPDAHVGPAARAESAQRVRVEGFVRHEVRGVREGNGSGRLGELRHQSPILLIAETLRQARGAEAARAENRDR